MVLTYMDIWDIVDGSEKALPSHVDPKMLKEYQRRVKTVMSIMSLNIGDNQHVHIGFAKGPAET